MDESRKTRTILWWWAKYAAVKHLDECIVAFVLIGSLVYTQESPRKRVGLTEDGPGQIQEVKAIQQTRRLLANARERTRVHTISAAFEALRKQVSLLCQDLNLNSRHAHICSTNGRSSESSPPLRDKTLMYKNINTQDTSRTCREKQLLERGRRTSAHSLLLFWSFLSFSFTFPSVNLMWVDCWQSHVLLSNWRSDIFYESIW